MIVRIIFWILLSLLIYTYLGYTLLLLFTSFVKKLTATKSENNYSDYLPDVTIVVAAYNEENNIADKVLNTLQQDYPRGKIAQLWVNDSSTDKTKDLLSSYNDITILTQPERMGKIAAINLAMQHVKTPISIFSDANAMLSANTVRKLVAPFSNPKVGCVAGEKRISTNSIENATASEGTYWRYESLIKKLESDCGSTLSATGELYAIRTELFENVNNNTILDDFVISINVVRKGYLIKYVPDAHTSEKASVSITEEKKRKVRIAAGSFQAFFQNTELINPLKYPKFSFQLFSHKIFRWFLLPISIILIPLFNIYILTFVSQNPIYTITFLSQLLLLAAIIAGWWLKDKKIALKWIFLPYYLFMMNISIIQGFIRFVKGRQSVKWEKSLRQT